MEVELKIPKKLIPVFTGDALYRGAYGGRGSAKTRTFAKMTAVRGLILDQAGEQGLIVCGRQFQNSLDESSMAEVKAAILEEPWLASHYDIGEHYIRTKSRRIEYDFVGFERNKNSIKSKARILLLWADEAEDVKESAWVKIIPTVREEGSEIWVTWNPEDENSATNQRFRIKPPASSKIVEMNWSDNPWFPENLNKKRLEDKERRPESYAHIWEGAYNTRSEARVFKNWSVEEFEIPADAEIRQGADWGFSVDPSVLVQCYVQGRKLFICNEAYKVGCEIDLLPALFMTVPDSEKWPIIADSARPETISYMQRHGFPRILPAAKGARSVEEGIEFIQAFDVIIHPRCINTIKEFKAYSYKTDDLGNVLPILDDKDNHVIDAVRYALEASRRISANKPKADYNFGSYW